MADEQKEVEGVEKIESASSQSTQPAPADDPEAKLNALLAENEKLRADRDNYRTATLALKGKRELEELDLSDPIQADAFIQKSIEERLAAERQSKIEGEITEDHRRVLRENKELKLALQGKTNLQGVGSGASGDSGNSQSGYFTSDQKEEMRKRFKAQGIKEDKWEGMIKKAEENSKRSTMPGTV